MRKFILPLLAFLASIVAIAPAEAQVSTCPTFYYGLVLTAAQWQACFDAKQNALGYTPVNKAGDTMLGPLIANASISSAAGWSLQPGSAPTSPNNGDMWVTAAGLFVQVNGATVGPLTNGISPSLLSGHIYVGNSSNVAAAVAMSGDATISNAGALTVSTLNGVAPGAVFPKNLGTSVNDPGTGNLEALLPVKTNTYAGFPGTACTASCVFTGADFQYKIRRSNSGSAMTDTLPASSATGLVNGTRIDIANVDASASDTLTAGSGTSIASGCTVIGPGRDILFVYDLANTTWRGDANTCSSLLSGNNLSDLSSAPQSLSNINGAYVQLPSIAALRAITAANAALIGTVQLNGYYAAGDLGLTETLNWVSGSSATDDGCTVINPTANVGNGRWLLNWGSSIVVRQCGAKINGTTNDTTAQIAAYTACPSSTYYGCKITIPSGSGKEVLQGLTLGNSNSNITWDGSQINLAPSNIATATPIMTLGDTSGRVTNSNFNITCNSFSTFATVTTSACVHVDSLGASTINLSATGFQYGLDLSPAFATGNSAIFYDKFFLGNMFDNLRAINLDTTNTSVNADIAFGGHVGISMYSGPYSAGLEPTGLFINDVTGANAPNAFAWYSPDIEGAECGGTFAGNHNALLNIRWEPTISGTEGTDYCPNFWTIGTTGSTYFSKLDFLFDGSGYSHSLGAGTMVDSQRFTVSGDQTLWTWAGAPITYEIGGVYYSSTVLFASTYNSGTGLTTITLLANNITGNPTAVAVKSFKLCSGCTIQGMRLYDPSTPISGVSNRGVNIDENINQVFIRSHIFGTAPSSSEAFLTMAGGASANDECIHSVGFTGGENASWYCNGQANFQGVKAAGIQIGGTLGGSSAPANPLSVTSSNSSAAVFNNGTSNTVVIHGSALVASAGNTNTVIDIGANTTTRSSIRAAGGVQIVATTSATVLALTCGSSQEGTMIPVTDANSATFNAALAGGGTNHMIGYCNGTAWVVH